MICSLEQAPPSCCATPLICTFVSFSSFLQRNYRRVAMDLYPSIFFHRRVARSAGRPGSSVHNGSVTHQSVSHSIGARSALKQPQLDVSSEVPLPPLVHRTVRGGIRLRLSALRAHIRTNTRVCAYVCPVMTLSIADWRPRSRTIVSSPSVVVVGLIGEPRSWRGPQRTVAGPAASPRLPSIRPRPTRASGK